MFINQCCSVKIWRYTSNLTCIATHIGVWTKSVILCVAISESHNTGNYIIWQFHTFSCMLLYACPHFATFSYNNKFSLPVCVFDICMLIENRSVLPTLKLQWQVKTKIITQFQRVAFSCCQHQLKFGNGCVYQHVEQDNNKLTIMVKYTPNAQHCCTAACLVAKHEWQLKPSLTRCFYSCIWWWQIHKFEIAFFV